MGGSEIPEIPMEAGELCCVQRVRRHLMCANQLSRERDVLKNCEGREEEGEEEGEEGEEGQCPQTSEMMIMSSKHEAMAILRPVGPDRLPSMAADDVCRDLRKTLVEGAENRSQHAQSRVINAATYRFC